MSLAEVYRRVHDPRLERSALLTDPHRPDNPIVYANNAFLRQTGYTRDEVLGHNCRFLQGPETDPNGIDAIRYALAHLLVVEVDLLNYRKDGTTFWNRVRIRPILDAQGGLDCHTALLTTVGAEAVRAEPVFKTPSLDAVAEPQSADSRVLSKNGTAPGLFGPLI